MELIAKCRVDDTHRMVAPAMACGEGMRMLGVNKSRGLHARDDRLGNRAVVTLQANSCAIARSTNFCILAIESFVKVGFGIPDWCVFGSVYPVRNVAGGAHVATRKVLLAEIMLGPFKSRSGEACDREADHSGYDQENFCTDHRRPPRKILPDFKAVFRGPAFE
ncbi:hypothetical protein JYU10_00570 [bacterium AH-315-J04]|nr:hypothetical protein [bacterium AH-315-J04]